VVISDENKSIGRMNMDAVVNDVGAPQEAKKENTNRRITAREMIERSEDSTYNEAQYSKDDY
jgi:hypothetical protein